MCHRVRRGGLVTQDEVFRHFYEEALRAGVAPPTIGYREPDPLCDLDVVPNEARNLAMNAAISNSFGFGGLNAVLAVKGV